MLSFYDKLIYLLFLEYWPKVCKCTNKSSKVTLDGFPVVLWAWLCYLSDKLVYRNEPFVSRALAKNGTHVHVLVQKPHLLIPFVKKYEKVMFLELDYYLHSLFICFYDELIYRSEPFVSRVSVENGTNKTRAVQKAHTLINFVYQKVWKK